MFIRVRYVAADLSRCKLSAGTVVAVAEPNRGVKSLVLALPTLLMLPIRMSCRQPPRRSPNRNQRPAGRQPDLRTWYSLQAVSSDGGTWRVVHGAVYLGRNS